MKQLSTIQKREKLNGVYAVDEKGQGGAHHTYAICSEKGNFEFTKLYFQKGPRNVESSRAGVIDSDLLEIVRHRLTCFQEGEFKTRENAMALSHIEEALFWLNKRVEDRIERDVLGTKNI